MRVARVSLAVFLMILMLAEVRAAEQPTRAFNIPAQPLAEALADFSRQSDVIVLAPSTLTGGRTSKAVAGEMSPARALDQLLDGTDLHYVMEQDGSVILQGQASRAEAQSDSSSIALAQVDQPASSSSAE